MNRLRKSPEENLLQYQLRLFKNKDIYGLSFKRIADLINEETGRDYGESKYRKYMIPFIDGYDFAIRNNISNEEALSELELKRIELEEERKKLQTIRVDYNKLIREKSRRDLIFEHVKDGFQSLPTPKVEISPARPKQENRKAILSFGDAHWGKVFESIHNEYSPEIFEQRMKQLAEESVAYLHKEGFDELEVLSMADSIEGMTLRVSQLQTLRVGFIDQAIMFSKFMATWLNELSRYFNKITYRHIPSSNHSEIRPFNSSRNEFPAEDLEKVIINYLHDVLKDNDRIEIPLYTDNLIDFEIFGLNHAATHGHAFRKTKNLIKDLSFHRRKFYSYLWIAHYHHSDVVTVGEGVDHNVETITVPSIMGSDTYSDSLLTGSKAGAVINIFEEGKGRTDQHNIILN